MNYETVIYERKGKIAYVTLNRPHRLNAFDEQMKNDLHDAWQEYGHDNEAWVAVLTGAGRAFCTGADVKRMSSAQSELGRSHMLPSDVDKVFWAPKYLNIWKPVIAAVNGICCSGAFHFINNSDIVICSENATFFDTHLDVGHAAAWEPIGLSRRIPLGAALRVLLLGKDEKMSASRAYELGLVSEVLPQDKLMPRATELAEIITLKSPVAVRCSLEAVWKGLNLGLRDAWDYGHHVVLKNFESEDFKGGEGPRAFVEKRRPVWKNK